MRPNYSPNTPWGEAWLLFAVYTGGYMWVMLILALILGEPITITRVGALITLAIGVLVFLLLWRWCAKEVRLRRFGEQLGLWDPPPGYQYASWKNDPRFSDDSKGRAVRQRFLDGERLSDLLHEHIAWFKASAISGHHPKAMATIADLETLTNRLDGVTFNDLKEAIEALEALGMMRGHE